MALHKVQDTLLFAAEAAYDISDVLYPIDLVVDQREILLSLWGILTCIVQGEMIQTDTLAKLNDLVEEANKQMKRIKR